MQRFVGKTASDIRNHPMLLTVPEMFFAFLSVFTCLLYMDGVMPDSIPPEMQRLFLLSFLFIGLMRFFRAEGNRYRNPSPALRRLDFTAAAICAVSCVLLLFRSDPDMQTWVCRVFLLITLTRRVLSVIQDPRWHNILVNIALAALTVYYTIEVWIPGRTWVGVCDTMLLAAWLSLFDIMTYVFSRVRLELLRKIARETYGAEILFGLVMLIITFSLVLKITENGIQSYRDALWYCFALVTTIGLGDISAVSDLGRIISVILGIYGIIVVALITSIIVNFYGEIKKTGTGQRTDRTGKD